jgi:hypothetical protein
MPQHLMLSQLSRIRVDKTLFDKSTIENNYGKRAQSGKVIKNYKNQIMNRNFENNIRCHLQ